MIDSPLKATRKMRERPFCSCFLSSPLILSRVLLWMFFLSCLPFRSPHSSLPKELLLDATSVLYLFTRKRKTSLIRLRFPCSATCPPPLTTSPAHHPFPSALFLSIFFLFLLFRVPQRLLPCRCSQSGHTTRARLAAGARRLCSRRRCARVPSIGYLVIIGIRVPCQER